MRKMQQPGQVVALLALILVVILSACGGPTRPPEDIAPVAVTPVAPTVTPVEPTAAPPAEATAAGQPAPTESAGVAAGEPAVNFTISGGLIGFCEELTIMPDGEYSMTSCRYDPRQGTLEPPDRELLAGWYNSLADFRLAFEDNPGGPDNLSTELVFQGAGTQEPDEAQQQAVFDWVNGLVLRLGPQPTPQAAAATPPSIGPGGLCPDVARPALIIANYENPSGLLIVDPDSGTQCDVVLHQPPFGRIVTANGSIYYPVFDPEAKTITIWQLTPAGETRPLDFTGVTMEEFGPFHFIVSADGSKVAWARAVIDAADPEAPVYANDLWMANVDGSNPVVLLAGVTNNDRRYVEPVRFSPDGSTLYYALQPDGLGGMIFSFSGRYDSMYRLAATGGQPELIYACSQGEQAICIGDISADGSVLAAAPHGQGVVQVIGGDGSVLSSLTPPAADYVGWPVFGPQGSLAFVSMTLSPGSEEAPPRPSPGYISLVTPPYTGQPQTIFSDDSVATLWEWLDENRLAYGAMDQEGSIGTGVVTVDGQQKLLSPNYALAVLR